jgi:hypothetical protein
LRPFADVSSDELGTYRFEYWDVEDELLIKAGLMKGMHFTCCTSTHVRKLTHRTKDPDAEEEEEEEEEGDKALAVEEMIEELNEDFGYNLSFPFGAVPPDLGFGVPTPQVGLNPKPYTLNPKP